MLKTLKNAPTCFDYYSDHLQGARRFLVKVILHIPINAFLYTIIY